MTTQNTLTPEQTEYVLKYHRTKTREAIYTHLGISKTKLYENLVFMGLIKDSKFKKFQRAAGGVKDGFFNVDLFEAEMLLTSR